MKEISKALKDCFISPNVMDSNWEAANFVDVVQGLNVAVKNAANTIAAAIDNLADAIRDNQ